jgi:dihydroorotate dehydrogenase (fumarate)
MAQQKASYLGIELKNPLVVGSCSFTANMDSLKRIEDDGAGAVVIKSLFEEQVQLERFKMEEDLEKFNYRHPEMITVFPEVDEVGGADEHLMWARKAKESLSIPVIASLGAENHKSWLEYAKQLEQTGVDALELNFYAVPDSMDTDAASIEKEQVSIVEEVAGSLKIPVAAKLSSYYTSPLNFMKRIDEAGARGLVLFNRLYHPAIDPEKQQHLTRVNLSHSSDVRLPLRFAGLLYGNIQADVCTSGGVHSGKDAASMLLAGASSFQIVSALYQHGLGHIGTILKELDAWMEEKQYATIDDFQGKLSRKNTEDPWIYARAQYINMLFRSKDLVDNYPSSV